ncbi:MipA/OmpV family protein [Congregibacter litoralis]|uniref:MipA/OmpV family protein n=1 Tax=Congregibacter litoralis TaxID=393662 RepID=UPI0003248FA5|nr:MipA/OmpV family protein [Congregibacter litoralis]
MRRLNHLSALLFTLCAGTALAQTDPGQAAASNQAAAPNQAETLDQAAAPPAASAARSPMGLPLGWRSEFGAGLIVNPKFAGSDEYNVTPIPYFDFRYVDEAGTKYFANVPQGLGGFLYRSGSQASGNSFKVGASIAPGFNVRDDSIDGLDEVGVSTEARLFVEVARGRWSGNATFAQDVGSGHEGAYLDLSVNRRGRLMNGRGFYAVGPVLRFGDSVYKDSLFGITPEESIETGLPEYSAEAGVERLGLQALVSLPVGKSKWRFTTIVRGSQLIDNAADSPIVVDETQFFLLTSLTRNF